MVTKGITVTGMTPTSDILQAQLEERIRFESLLADLSARFVLLPSEALDREIVDAQRRIGETLGIDGSTLGQPSPARRPAVDSHVGNPRKHSHSALSGGAVAPLGDQAGPGWPGGAVRLA